MVRRTSGLVHGRRPIVLTGPPRPPPGREAAEHHHSTTGCREGDDLAGRELADPMVRGRQSRRRDRPDGGAGGVDQLDAPEVGRAVFRPEGQEQQRGVGSRRHPPCGRQGRKVEKVTVANAHGTDRDPAVAVHHVIDRPQVRARDRQPLSVIGQQVEIATTTTDPVPGHAPSCQARPLRPPGRPPSPGSAAGPLRAPRGSARSSRRCGRRRRPAPLPMAEARSRR